MNNLFNQITGLTPTISGWCSVEKAQKLAAMVVALEPDTSCEIGVFAGRSFFAIALAHKFINKGVAIGIEPWDKQASMEGYVGDNLNYWRDMNFEMVRAQFYECIDRLGLRPFTQIIQKRSDEVEPMTTRLFHCDGQHTEQAIKDVRRFAPLVEVGGIVVLDDVEWANEGKQPVREAAGLLLQMGFKKLYSLGTGAAFQRC